jgi:hypothetical protein
MKAHDVRRLNLCAKCGKVGIHKPDGITFPPLVILHGGKYYHPTCLSLRELLTADSDEIKSIRICDVPMAKLKMPHLASRFASLTTQNSVERSWSPRTAQGKAIAPGLK